MSRPRSVVLTAGLALATAAGLAAPANAGNGNGNGNGPKTTTYTAQLTSLNGSGVTGTATLTYSRGRLTVHVQAQGVEAGRVHPQHIHGDDKRTNTVCPPPSAADDIPNSPDAADNPDEFISVPEGQPFYGEILRPLTPFPTPSDTTIDFTETYQGKEIANLQPVGKTLQNRHIVLHGDTLPNGTYLGTLPVACGQIERAN